MLSLKNYLYISTIIFCLGIFGILFRKKFLYKLISSSLIALSAIINFISFSYFLYPEKIFQLTLIIFMIGLIIMQFAIGFFVYYLVKKEGKDIDLKRRDPFLELNLKIANFFRRE